jgi:hypothetical protein
VVALGPYERALVTRRGKPARWLGAGVQQVWTTERCATAQNVRDRDERRTWWRQAFFGRQAVSTGTCECRTTRSATLPMSA